MNLYVYNGSLLIGTALIGVGAGLVSIPLGLVATGALILGIALYHMRIS